MRNTWMGVLALAIGISAVSASGSTSTPEVAPNPAPRGNEPFIGEILAFGGNFAPRGWAKCEGQLLPINSNAALFSILGTTYGGDGRTTFGLPDLRGRAVIGPGTGPGLPSYNLGQSGASDALRAKGADPKAQTGQALGMTYCIALQGTFPSRN